MENISTYLPIVFIVITVLTVLQFYKASKNHTFLFVIILWMVAQVILAKSGFFLDEVARPPRFVFLVMPPMLVIIGLCLTHSGKKFLDKLDIKQITLLHTVRIPVEIVLYFLFIAGVIPEIMTFDGSNFDILIGLTAPIIYYFAFIRQSLSQRAMIIWNFVGLALLANIVVIAILSSKTPFQQFAFDQPNIAVASFPFNWLPSVVVPIVLLSHIATLRQLYNGKKATN